MTKRERTKAKIKDCYIKLLKTHSPDDISVTEICDICDINRSTFYEYFSYIDELIKEVIYDQIGKISEINDILYDDFYFQSRLEGPERVKQYIENITSNEVLMKFIRDFDGNKYRSIIVRAQCEYEMNRYNITDTAKSLKVIYRNSGVLTIVFRWIEHGFDLSLDETSKLLFDEICKSEELV